jgi:hypothetical protein
VIFSRKFILAWSPVDLSLFFSTIATDVSSLFQTLAISACDREPKFGLDQTDHDDSIARVSKPRLHRRTLRDALVADLRNVATGPLDKNIGEVNPIVNGRAGRKD